MEDPAVKDHSAAGKSTSRLLRYPLRSATKSKDEKPPLADTTNSASATKKGRVASSVSKSVNVLDLSGKDKSAKPPRRLSVPSKSNASPAAKSVGTITPISEARTKRAGTPVSDVSRSSNNRKKFSVLSSASYWLSQIKLSETAAKHSISLGFFKLALEAGCEPIQRMTDELKVYVRNHNLSELGDTVKELFEGYKISENFEPSQGSETCPQVPAKGNQLSDDNDDANSSSSSITDAEKLKPKSLDINAGEIRQENKANNETAQNDGPVKKTRKSVPPKNNAAAISKSGSEVKGRSISQKKPQKTVKQVKDKLKKQGKKSAPEEGPLTPPSEETLQENKENMVGEQMEEITESQA